MEQVLPPSGSHLQVLALHALEGFENPGLRAVDVPVRVDHVSRIALHECEAGHLSSWLRIKLEAARTELGVVLSHRLCIHVSAAPGLTCDLGIGIHQHWADALLHDLTHLLDCRLGVGLREGQQHLVMDDEPHVRGEARLVQAQYSRASNVT
ncbi:hypothetical protein CASbig_43 [Mycobacterium phage CASbig]|uniref:hypothetical protein n=1 Tax=Mycobacterium phage CASbig TaxID=1327035 RepID=UPI00032B5939|nr:hypothetical protein JMN56_gp43 [Mycobacterium phage CASbig]AGK88090.1 hypothetical protein CASbig_43 [Mycobacterium phage CASbig]